MERRRKRAAAIRRNIAQLFKKGRTTEEAVAECSDDAYLII